MTFHYNRWPFFQVQALCNLRYDSFLHTHTHTHTQRLVGGCRAWQDGHANPVYRARILLLSTPPNDYVNRIYRTWISLVKDDRQPVNMKNERQWKESVQQRRAKWQSERVWWAGCLSPPCSSATGRGRGEAGMDGSGVCALVSLHQPEWVVRVNQPCKWEKKDTRQNDWKS